MAVTGIEAGKKINNRRLGFFLAGSDINKNLVGKELFYSCLEQNFMQTQKIVRQNQGNVCGNKQIMLTRGGWCKRKRAETVERLELSRLRKKGHNQSLFK